VICSTTIKSKIFITEDDLSDIINYVYNEHKYNENKLNTFIDQINEQLQNPGKYKLKLINNVSYILEGKNKL